MILSQIGILILQGILVALLLLILFRLRKPLGTGVLFACLGLFQLMQNFLSNTIYIEIGNNTLVSPGSSIIFTATLFIILLIYIKEDASETRKIIYALLVVNIVMAFFIWTFGWNAKSTTPYNPFNLPDRLLIDMGWHLFVGTILLFIDSLLIILIYEYISRHLSNLFLQICLTMILVVSFDSIFFVIFAFWNVNNLGTILISGLISKNIYAIFYSILFYLYLKYIETKEYNSEKFKIKDIFLTLSYKQKFEIAQLDAIKTSEEIELKDIKYKTLTDISPVGIFHTQRNGSTTFVNQRWCEISGMTYDEALGNGWIKAVHPDDIQATISDWNDAVKQRRISIVEYRFILKDGTTKWVLGQAVPELNREKQIIGFVGTITDITDLKLYQQEQIMLKEKAEESNRLKSAFLTNISHEIRTPMNGILGFAELLKEPTITGEQQKTYIRNIEKNSERMLNILGDLVKISKIETGIVGLKFNDLDIKKQFIDIYNTFKPLAEKKGIDFSFKYSSQCRKIIVKTDTEKFKYVFCNLVKNAIKYCDKGIIQYGCLKNNKFLKLYVKDTGIGIPKDKQEAIFERFIQVDIDNTMAKQGAGLGLAISKTYIEMLGGEIWVESKEGEGSTFYFTIPYK